MGRQPCGETLVVREIRSANSFTTGFENTLAGPHTACCGRRCGLAFKKLAENPLLSGRSHAISRSTNVNELRKTELRATIEVAHEAQRSEWSDEKRSIGNRVRQTDVRERCDRRKAVAETIGPIYGRPPRAQSLILVAGRCRSFHVGREVDSIPIDSNVESKVGVAKSIHEAVGSRCRGSRGCCGRGLNKIERETNVGLEVSAKAVTSRRV